MQLKPFVPLISSIPNSRPVKSVFQSSTFSEFLKSFDTEKSSDFNGIPENVSRNGGNELAPTITRLFRSNNPF